MIRGAFRAVRILLALARRNLFWGLYRDVYWLTGRTPTASARGTAGSSAARSACAKRWRSWAPPS
jgi:hypothetical protein